MRRGVWCWVLCTLFLGGEATATLAITGEVLIEPPAATLLRGQTATITYIITNTGDEPLDRAASGTLYFNEGPTSTVFPFPTAATPPCAFQLVDLSAPPGQPAIVGNTNTFLPAPIAPGESRRCAMGLQVSSQAGGPFVQQFLVSGSRGNQQVLVARDIAFPLGQTSFPVPAGSVLGLVLLAATLLAIGYRRLPS